MPLVKIGELIVDEESGEIIDIPEEADQYEHLTRLAVEAGRQAKDWKRQEDIYRRVLLGLLDGDERDEITSAAGQVKVRTRTTRKVTRDRMQRAGDSFELAVDQREALVLATAKEFDWREVQRFCERIKHSDLSDFLIEESESRWAEVKALRLPAPKVVEVPAGDPVEERGAEAEEAEVRRRVEREAAP